MYEIKYRDDLDLINSGVEWLGNIPIDWDTGRIQRYFANKSEKVSDKIFEALSVTKNGILKQLENVAKTDNGDNRKKVLKGDFVINSRADRKGSCGVSPYNGSVSLICHVLSPNDKIEPSFANHLFRNYYFSEEFYRWGTGIVDDLWSTNKDRMAKIIIPVPPLYQQQNIANFLDIKITQFDSIISKKEQLIKKLEEAKTSLISEVVTGKVKIEDGQLVPRDASEMMDSGIEWLGMVPLEWNLTRIGRIAFVTKLAGFEFTEHMANSIKEEGQVPVVMAQNVKMNRFIDNYQGFIDYELSLKLSRCALYKRSILMTFIGAGIGEVAIFEKENRHHLAPNVAKIEINKSISNRTIDKFILYVLMSSFGQTEAKQYFKATAQPSLSMTNIRNIKIVVPDYVNQTQIVEYLDARLKKIDNSIGLSTEELKQLKLAKQSLISEAVTGKIDLRDWEIIEEGELQ